MLVVFINTIGSPQFANRFLILGVLSHKSGGRGLLGWLNAIVSTIIKYHSTPRLISLPETKSYGFPLEGLITDSFYINGSRAFPNLRLSNVRGQIWQNLPSRFAEFKILMMITAC